MNKTLHEMFKLLNKYFTHKEVYYHINNYAYDNFICDEYDSIIEFKSLFLDFDIFIYLDNLYSANNDVICNELNNIHFKLKQLYTYKERPIHACRYCLGGSIYNKGDKFFFCNNCDFIVHNSVFNKKYGFNITVREFKVLLIYKFITLNYNNENRQFFIVDSYSEKDNKYWYNVVMLDKRSF
jgi:hypothetical protein